MSIAIKTETTSPVAYPHAHANCETLPYPANIAAQQLLNNMFLTVHCEICTGHCDRYL